MVQSERKGAVTSSEAGSEVWEEPRVVEKGRMPVRGEREDPSFRSDEMKWNFGLIEDELESRG